MLFYVHQSIDIHSTYGFKCILYLYTSSLPLLKTKTTVCKIVLLPVVSYSTNKINNDFQVHTLPPPSPKQKKKTKQTNKQKTTNKKNIDSCTSGVADEKKFDWYNSNFCIYINLRSHSVNDEYSNIKKSHLQLQQV